MLCPKCQLDLRIVRDRLEVTGDKSVDETTKVFDVQELTCANPKCENNNQIVHIVRHLIYEN